MNADGIRAIALFVLRAIALFEPQMKTDTKKQMAIAKIKFNDSLFITRL
jgi:hypothetical protein